MEEKLKTMLDEQLGKLMTCEDKEMADIIAQRIDMLLRAQGAADKVSMFDIMGKSMGILKDMNEKTTGAVGLGLNPLAMQERI